MFLGECVSSNSLIRFRFHLILFIFIHITTLGCIQTKTILTSSKLKSFWCIMATYPFYDSLAHLFGVDLMVFVCSEFNALIRKKASQYVIFLLAIVPLLYSF